MAQAEFNPTQGKVDVIGGVPEGDLYHQQMACFHLRQLLRQLPAERRKMFLLEMQLEILALPNDSETSPAGGRGAAKPASPAVHVTPKHGPPLPRQYSRGGDMPPPPRPPLPRQYSRGGDMPPAPPSSGSSPGLARTQSVGARKRKLRRTDSNAVSP